MLVRLFLAFKTVHVDGRCDWGNAGFSQDSHVFVLGLIESSVQLTFGLQSN